MSKDFLKIRKGLGFPGGTAPADPENGDVYYSASLNTLNLYSSGSWKSFLVGTMPKTGMLSCNVISRSSTSLPTGASCVIDGVTLADDDLVLFTNLTTGANQVYKIGGVGSSITWTLQTTFFSGNASPVGGDLLVVTEGTLYSMHVFGFDGYVWFDYAAQPETLLNKKLDDSTTEIVDSSDPTKKIKFDAAGTAGTSTTLTGSQTANRVVALPDETGTLASQAYSKKQAITYALVFS